MITRYPTRTDIYGKNPSTGASEAIWKDPVVGAMVQIDTAHEAIHLGKYFNHGGTYSVANGATYDHLLRTPAVGGKFIHLRLFTFSSTSAPLFVDFREAPTNTALGSLQTCYNFNRNFSNATLLVYHQPTITALGTKLNGDIVAGTKQSGGNDASSGTEWVLLQGTDYLLRVTNSSGGSADIGFSMEWYEL
jgi:hypothetical protein